MPRHRKDDDEKHETLFEAFDHLDAAHVALIRYAEEQGIEHEAEDELTGDDGDEFPSAAFWVGGKKIRPARGEVVVDARLTLKLSNDQVEALMFELTRRMREGRAGDDTVEVDLDGRLLIGEEAVGDLREALR